jgi:hypothetical protein
VQHAVRIVAVVVALVAAYVTSTYVLSLPHGREPWAAVSRTFSSQPLKTLATGCPCLHSRSRIPESFSRSITRWACDSSRAFFARGPRGRPRFAGFEADWAKPTERIVRFALIAMARRDRVPLHPGSDSEAFKGIGGRGRFSCSPSDPPP